MCRWTDQIHSIDSPIPRYTAGRPQSLPPPESAGSVTANGTKAAHQEPAAAADAAPVLLGGVVEREGACLLAAWRPGVVDSDLDTQMHAI